MRVFEEIKNTIETGLGIQLKPVWENILATSKSRMYSL